MIGLQESISPGNMKRLPLKMAWHLVPTKQTEIKYGVIPVSLN